MSCSREEVATTDRWNVEELYSSTEAWEQNFAEVGGDTSAAAEGRPRWPALAKQRGKLDQSAATVAEAIETLLSTAQHLERLYTYAHLRHDEDTAHDGHKTAYQRAYAALVAFQEESAWFEPELLSLPQDVLESYLTAPELAPYQFHIEKIVRVREHTLSPDQEELLALSGNALATAGKAFNALNDADLKFGSVLDSEGIEHPLTHGTYMVLLRSPDRTLRKNAYRALHRRFHEHKNSITELLAGQVHANIFDARAHRYQSALEAALYPKNIGLDVYHSLLKAIDAKLPLLHRYVALRKRLLRLDELHVYDLYVPLLEEVDMQMEYAEAERVIIESVAPLGEEYQETLRKGLQEERWVDRYENRNKRSGAYSSGCYDSPPYILMNYKGILRDVATLAHEAGHSMHSQLSRTNQPFHYSRYPIFVAEVASTFNEELLTQHLLQTTNDPLQRAFLLNEKIEDIRATLIRQAMFAEFELTIHERVQHGKPLTPRSLREYYRELNSRYFGPEVVMDEEAEIEWARIPHFYYNFYVYQYATGISAALSLTKRVLEGGTEEREAYLQFLKGGCSRYPLDLLRDAGVDLETPEPVETALNTFGNLVDELDQTLQQLDKQPTS